MMIMVVLSIFSYNFNTHSTVILILSNHFSFNMCCSVQTNLLSYYHKAQAFSLYHASVICNHSPSPPPYLRGRVGDSRA